MLWRPSGWALGLVWRLDGHMFCPLHRSLGSCASPPVSTDNQLAVSGQNRAVVVRNRRRGWWVCSLLSS